MADQPLERIQATGVTVAFGQIDVVSKVDLTLRSGEIHAITGENGAGKSSLAKAIAGVYKLKSGSILLDAASVHFKNPREALTAGVALIHQEPLTFPDLEVAENIFAGHYLRRGILADRTACRARAADLLASLGSDLKPTDRVSNLSVAQRQLVELAGALAYDAKVWIFDETTAPLTPKEVAELFVVMRRLRDRGCALAMVSHHLHEVFEISDRITVLRDGAKVAELETLQSTPSEIVKLMVGRDIEPLTPAPRRAEDGAEGDRQQELLAVDHLTGVGFKDISLHVKAGEILGVAGLVGAGRSELTRALFGITHPTSGVIKLSGNPVQIDSPQSAIKLGIALVPEDRAHEGLFLIQSIAFNS
ncbi:MAG: sugar ABC transporter ATP-binding protein, partial [Fimbriimonadaceae bacterium]